MSLVSAFGYIAAAFTLATFAVTTMIPLRLMGIGANLAFISYGFVGELYPVLILHTLLLPLNVFRLRQMMVLTRKATIAAQSDFNFDWLKPFMRQRSVRKGEVLFAKGDDADTMFYVLDGQYRLLEIDKVVTSGEIVGEIGIVAPGGKRTLTLECTESGSLLAVSYDHVRQLFYQNPRFGFYLLQLVAQRLSRDVERLGVTFAVRELQ